MYEIATASTQSQIHSLTTEHRTPPPHLQSALWRFTARHGLNHFRNRGGSHFKGGNYKDKLQFQSYLNDSDSIVTYSDLNKPMLNRKRFVVSSSSLVEADILPLALKDLFILLKRFDQILLLSVLQ